MKKLNCVIKRTAYEYYTQSDAFKKKYASLQKEIKFEIEQNHRNHHALLDALKTLSKTLRLNIVFFTEDQISQCKPGTDDLIISFGGDGTFLSCAQRFPDNVLLGINSDFRQFDSGKGSYGALTALNFISLERGLKKIDSGDYKVISRMRLGISLNGNPTNRFAVNDVYIGGAPSYQTHDISIVHNEIQENFLCSGLVACTGMGSHAWYRAAGGTPFSNELHVFGFAVLMPNAKKRYRYTSGIVGHPGDLQVYPSRDKYIISFDSKPDIIEIGMGDKVEIYLSDRSPVWVVDL